MPLEKLMSISLASPEVEALTIHRALDRKAYSLRRLRHEHEWEGSIRVITNLLIVVDVASGGDGDVNRLKVIAAGVLQSCPHRSLGFVILALRDGMRAGAKVYGRLSAQVVGEWIAAKEAEVLTLAEDDHARAVTKNDNVGADYMDRLEHDATSKDRTIGAQSRLIDELRRKLQNPTP